MIFWLFLLFLLLLLFYHLAFRFVLVFLFGVLSADCTLFVFFQEIFSSDHNIFWSPITSVFILLVWFLFWRLWFKFFFFLFTWRISVLVFKELFHFTFKFGHDFISKLLFHGVECLSCVFIIEFFFAWWGISGYIIIDFFQSFHEQRWILALLFNDFGCLLDFFEELLKVFPYFFEIFVIQLVVNFDAKIFDGVPFFILFGLYGSFFFLISIIIITKILR